MPEIIGLLIALSAGGFVGILTGLMPGIHVNVVAAVMVGVAGGLASLGFTPLAIAVFIVAVAITHAFFDIVPTLFLGIPADDVYALLPGHRLVHQGRGIEAMRLSVHGSWWGLTLATGAGLLFLALALAGLPLVANLDALLKPVILLVLVACAGVLVWTDKHRGWALTVFLLSGLFGLLILSSPLVAGGSNAAFSALFPALSGLFGVSGLVLALFDKAGALPPQDPNPPSDIAQGLYRGAIGSGAAGGMLVGLLPGLGAANAATLFSLVGGSSAQNSELNQRRYLVTTSAINTADTFFGIAALLLIGKARSGASVSIENLMPQITPGALVVMAVAMLGIGWLARAFILRNGLRLAGVINRFDYRRLTAAVIALIVALVTFTTGIWGLVILAATTLLGMVAPLTGIRRSQAMGLFLIPVILYFSGFAAPVVTLLGLEGVNLPAPPIEIWQVIGAVGGAVAAAAVVYHLVPRQQAVISAPAAPIRPIAQPSTPPPPSLNAQRDTVWKEAIARLDALGDAVSLRLLPLVVYVPWALVCLLFGGLYKDASGYSRRKEAFYHFIFYTPGAQFTHFVMFLICLAFLYHAYRARSLMALPFSVAACALNPVISTFNFRHDVWVSYLFDLLLLGVLAVTAFEKTLLQKGRKFIPNYWTASFLLALALVTGCALALSLNGIPMPDTGWSDGYYDD